MNPMAESDKMQFLLDRQMRSMGSQDLMLAAYLRGKGHAEAAEDFIMRLEFESRDPAKFVRNVERHRATGAIPDQIAAFLVNGLVIHHLLDHKKVDYVRDPALSPQGAREVADALDEIGATFHAQLCRTDPVEYSQRSAAGNRMLCGTEADELEIFVEAARAATEASQKHNPAHGQPGHRHDQHCSHAHAGHRPVDDYVGIGRTHDPLADQVLALVSPESIMPMHAVSALSEAMQRYVQLHPAQFDLALKSIFSGVIELLAEDLRARGKIPTGHHTGEAALQMEARSMINALLTQMAVESGDPDMQCNDCLLGTTFNGVGGLLVGMGKTTPRKLIQNLESVLNSLRVDEQRRKKEGSHKG